MFERPITIVAILMMLFLVTAGCGNQTETDSKKETANTNEPSGPKTFGEAAEQLVTVKNQIRDGFAKGDVDSAHGPLHEVGHVLENLAVLAREADLSDDQLKGVKEAKETLFDAFGNIDKTLHGGEGSTYEEEAETIKNAMKVIVEAAGVTDDSKAPESPAADDGLPADGGTVEAGDGP